MLIPLANASNDTGLSDLFGLTGPRWALHEIEPKVGTIAVDRLDVTSEGLQRVRSPSEVRQLSVSVPDWVVGKLSATVTTERRTKMLSPDRLDVEVLADRSHRRVTVAGEDIENAKESSPLVGKHIVQEYFANEGWSARLAEGDPTDAEREALLDLVSAEGGILPDSPLAVGDVWTVTASKALGDKAFGANDDTTISGMVTNRATELLTIDEQPCLQIESVFQDVRISNDTDEEHQKTDLHGRISSCFSLETGLELRGSAVVWSKTIGTDGEGNELQSLMETRMTASTTVLTD